MCKAILRIAFEYLCMAALVAIVLLAYTVVGDMDEGEPPMRIQQ